MILPYFNMFKPSWLGCPPYIGRNPPRSKGRCGGVYGLRGPGMPGPWGPQGDLGDAGKGPLIGKSSN